MDRESQFPPGTKMEQEDGRVYRYWKAGEADIKGGKIEMADHLIDGKLGLVLTKCVICGTPYFGGRQFTCSDKCHDEFVNRIIAKCGEFKMVVRASIGEAFKVPTRDILEKGVREQDLDRYPRWEGKNV